MLNISAFCFTIQLYISSAGLETEYANPVFSELLWSGPVTHLGGPGGRIPMPVRDDINI